MQLPGPMGLAVELIVLAAAFGFFAWSVIQLDQPRKKPRRR